MTYKDIVLQLLKTRGDLVCLEQHLLSDFKNNGSTEKDFKKWCETHEIEFSKVPSAEPARLHLKIKEYSLEQN